MTDDESGKLTETFTLKLSSEDIAQLETVVAIEKRHARPGHRVSTRDIARLAIRLYLNRRVPRRPGAPP